jgi:microcystin-dependent protein
MGASITLAGESLIAQKQGAQQVLDVARFVLANVPGLNPNAPVDRNGVKPPAAQIVYTAEVNRKGYVSPRQVIYSLMVGSDIGDWDFNWIGLETAENVLLAIAYVPLQQKRRNIPPQQIGNNVTRNFLVEFNGAQALTGLTVDASTWQHDFTIRLKGIDERERSSNRDVFGRACFYNSGLQMERNSFGLFQLKPGMAYIEGIRLALASAATVQLPALPAKAWLDVYLAHVGSDVVATWTVVFGANKSDYQDNNGSWHYVVELATIAASGAITDLRATQPISTDLLNYLAARNGDYAGLRARATTKDDVGLDQLPNAKSDDPGNNRSDVLATTKALKALKDSLKKSDVGLDQLPNAKSDDPATNSSDILATTKALNAVKTGVGDSMVGLIGMFAMASPPSGWLRANGAAVSRTAYAALFSRIGLTYGAGDGASTFNLPDARGRFPRFLDDGRGIDAGRAIGSDQAGSLETHVHPTTVSAAGGHTPSGITSTNGNHYHQTYQGDLTPAGVDYSGGEEPRNALHAGEASYSSKRTSADGDHSHGLVMNAVPDHDHVVTIHATGGSETRPVNIAFFACIKY